MRSLRFAFGLILATTCITNCKKKETPVVVPVVAVPVISTSAISGVNENSAICGGNITSEGKSAITAVGVCWDTSPTPTTLRPHTVDGAGVGTFNSSITGLTPGTTYYVRAYATNGNGTAYGNEVSFKTNNGWVKVGNRTMNVSATNGSLLMYATQAQTGPSTMNFFSSADNGATWSQASQIGMQINVLYSSGNTIFAGGVNSILKSTDKGATWKVVFDGAALSTPVNGYITCFTAQGNKIIAMQNIEDGTGNDASLSLISSDNGETWACSNGTVNDNYIYAVASNDQNIFAVGNGFGEVSISANHGTSWTTLNNAPSAFLLYAAILGSKVFVSGTTEMGGPNENVMAFSSDNGANWVSANTGLPATLAFDFAVHNNIIYTAAALSGVFASVDGGISWKAMNTGLADLGIKRMLINGSVLIAVVANGDIYNYQL